MSSNHVLLFVAFAFISFINSRLVSSFALIPTFSSLKFLHNVPTSSVDMCRRKNVFDSRSDLKLTAFINQARSTSIKFLEAKKSLDDDFEDDDFEDEEEVEYEAEYYEEGEEDVEFDDDLEAENAEDKAWVAEEIQARNLVQDLDEAIEELKNLDVAEIVENLTPEEIDEIESDEVEMEAEEKAKSFMLTEEDVLNISEEDITASSEEDESEDIFPADGDWIYGPNATLKQKDLKEFEEVMKKLEEVQEELNSGISEIRNIDMIDDDHIMMNVLDEETRNEILNLDDEVPLDEDGEPEEDKLHEQRRRLIYDLDFNITNIFLASFKVNPDAPVILEHWMYEMRNWTRYEYVRKNDFNFTWDDVDNSDTVELDKYWEGAGTDGTPTPTSRENPNIIEWDENPLTFEEEYLLALETWMDEVYKEEDDLNLDDEDLMPADNPAAPEHGILNHDDIPPEIKDVEEFEEKYAHMTQEWRDEYVKKREYEVESRVDSEFRGHLVIACSPSEEDLDMSEKLTMRMEKQFGEKVYVETRVVGHAKPEDHLYEIWLESWEIDLLHSKRRAVFQRDWDGPRDLTDEYIEDLVSKVEFYISDDFRHSFLIGDDGK